MGIEYKIKFQIRNKESIETFLKKLSTTFENEVFVSLEEDGIYFCDNLSNREIASKIFYRLIKEILTQNSEIKICEL